MKPAFIQSKVIVGLAVFTVCCTGVLCGQTPRPSASSSGDGHRHLAPDSGSSDGGYSPDQYPEDISPMQLVRLLTEQNKRLKEQVARLEKENAELKTKLGNQQ